MTGCFISVDPILNLEVPAHLHAYAYGFNNPVTFSDASGLEPRDKNGNFDGDPYDRGWGALKACDNTSCTTSWDLTFEPEWQPPTGKITKGLQSLVDVPCDSSYMNCASATSLGFEWLTGNGRDVEFFGSGDPMLEELRGHPGIEDVRDEMEDRLSIGVKDRTGGVAYRLGDWDGVGNFFGDYGDLLSGQSAVAFLGSYSGEVVVVDVRENTATLLWYVENTSDLASATHPPFYGEIDRGCGGCMVQWEEFVNSVPAKGGPLSSISQVFMWTETVEF